MSLFTTSTGKGVKFPQPGATITGKIAQAPFEKQATKFGSQEPDYWPNGDPKMQIVVPLTDTNAAPESGDDDGDRTLYVSSGSMKKAISDAMHAAGVPDVAVGGILTVTYVTDDPASKNPANPKKLYSAQYTPPASGLAQPAPAQGYAAPAPAAPAYPAAAAATAPAAAPGYQQPAPAPAPAAAPAVAPAPAPAAAPDATFLGITQEQHDKTKQLLALGALPPEQIAAALGITVDQVNTIAGQPF